MREISPQYEEAFRIADELFEHAEEFFGCAPDQLHKLDYVNMIIGSYHEIETVMPRHDRIFHRVSDRGAEAIYYSAKVNPDIYDVMREICARNLTNEAPLPFLFRSFIIDELNGDFDRTKRRGRSSSDGFAFRAYCYIMARYVSDATGVPLTRNEASATEISACDALFDVGPRHGLDIKYTTLRDWCTHKDYSGMRERADLLRGYFVDLYLVRLGVLKRLRV